MQTLQNHFLARHAEPHGRLFPAPLFILCEHSSEGAMGLVVNIPVDMSLDAMLTKLNLNPPPPRWKQPVLQGGTGDRGLCCTASARFNPTLQVSDEMMVTTSKDILGHPLAPTRCRTTGWWRLATPAGVQASSSRSWWMAPGWVIPPIPSWCSIPHPPALAASRQRALGSTPAPLQPGGP